MDKHFIWRAANDSLPTKQNLVRRNIPLDVTCSLCDDYQETILHALWLCDQAKSVWKSVPRFSGLYRSAHRNFVDLLDSVFELGSSFSVALFSTITWCLWQRRNKLRERQPMWPLQEICQKSWLWSSLRSISNLRILCTVFPVSSGHHQQRVGIKLTSMRPFLITVSWLGLVWWFGTVPVTSWGRWVKKYLDLNLWSMLKHWRPVELWS